MSFRFYDGHIYNQKDIWTDQFIDEHKEEIDWTKLLKKVMLTEEQIEKYSDYIIWKNVFLYQPVSEEFIEKHIDKLENFDWICINRSLSVPFVKKYLNKFHWGCVSVEAKMSKEFIYEFKDKIDWRMFTIHQYESWDESFLREFKDYIIWPFFFERASISNNFKREVLTKLFRNKNKRNDYVNFICNNITDKEWKEWKSNVVDPINLSENYKLSEQLIIENRDMFDYITVRRQRYNVSKKLRRAFGDKT